MDSTAIFCWELSKTLIYKLRINKLSRIVFLVLTFTLCSFNMFSQTTDLTTQITGPNRVKAGQKLKYEISFANNGPMAVNNAVFFAKLPENGVNITLDDCRQQFGANCPEAKDYTLKNGIFKGVIPFLPVNSRVIFVITLSSPSPLLQSSFSCMAQINPPASIQEIDIETNLASWNSTVVNNVDIKVEGFTRSFSGTSCESKNNEFDYTVKWVNNGPADAFGIILTSELLRNNVSVGLGNGKFKYNYSITNLKWKAGRNSIAPTDEFKNKSGEFIQSDSRNFNSAITELKGLVPKLASGDTITLSYSVKIHNVEKQGCDKSIEWTLRNVSDFTIPVGVYLNDTVRNNNSATVDIPYFKCETSCPKVNVKVIGSVNQKNPAECDNLPQIYTYNIKWINIGNVPVNGIELNNSIKRNNKSFGTGHTNYNYSYDISDIEWKSKKSSLNVNIPFFENGKKFTQDKNTNYRNINTLSSMVPVFLPGDTVELTFNFKLEDVEKIGCGRDILWSLRNESYFVISGQQMLVDSADLSNKNIIDIDSFTCSSDDCYKSDIQVKTYVSSDAGTTSCNNSSISYDFEIKWINNGPSNASGIIFNNIISRNNIVFGTNDVTYTYKYNISNVQWISNLSGILQGDKFSKTNGVFIQNKNDINFKAISKLIGKPVASFNSGETITLKFTFTIEDVDISGCGNSIEWDLKNDAYFTIPVSLQLKDTDTTENNKSSVIIKQNKASSTDLSISKKINQHIVNNGDIINVSLLFQNASSAPIGPATWIDTLPESFEINLNSIACKSYFGNTPCQNISYDPSTRVLTQTIPVMEANSAIEITYLGTIKALNSITESNRVYAIHPCSDCVPETNISQTNYQVYGECDLLNAGKNTEATVCDVFGRRLVLSDILEGNPDQNGKWTKIIGNGGDFESEKGIFTAHSGTTTTIFKYSVYGNVLCKADTAYLKLNFVCESDSITISAEPRFNAIDVEWTKMEENNVDFFEIYRSEDRIHYYKIGEQEGRGTEETSKKYLFTDNQVEANIDYYYKVVQNDFFGKETISNIDNAILEVGDFMVGNIFPNPTDYYFNISLFSSTDTDVNFRILTTLGQEVYFNSMRIPSGGTTILIDNLGYLAQGGYYFKVESNKLSFTETLVIARD